LLVLVLASGAGFLLTAILARLLRVGEIASYLRRVGL
jgi:hypothetical protein